MRRFLSTGLVVLLLATATFAREHRFTSGPYYGFTKLSSERNIIELDKPLHISQVSGVVTSAKDHQPLRKVLFELRDDGTGHVHATRTDAEGRFHFKKIKDGKYTFKVTSKGYQSVSGTMIVRVKAPESDSVNISMPSVL
ncbi:MAG TPA: carboxypeptidase-like regulatory domain-containing protein [Terriglobales bacterium]|nr:carboxypeptidase-like regulatory domain-containing protein [Terriglobales bacterium]